MPETRTVKGFSEVRLPLAEGDFECCTFDHSDNSPYLFSSVLSSKKLLENSLGRKQERRQKIFDFEIFCVEEYQGESGGRNSQLLPKFRVSSVMTTSMPLRMEASTYLSYHKFSRRATDIAAYFSPPPHEMIGRRESL